MDPSRPSPASTSLPTSLLPIPLPEAELRRLDAHFPVRAVALRDGARVGVRESGAGGIDAGEGRAGGSEAGGGKASAGEPIASTPLVCLHGIGSGSASWLGVAETLAGQARLIAWDAPGYGDSTPLPMARPRAVDYSNRLRALLDALAIDRCLLVGHSLGALMAAPTAVADGRVAALVLISPAQGYGAPGRESDQSRVRGERLAALDRLGIEEMAARRSMRLVSDDASDLARQWVHWNMAHLHDQGYRQAIELLCGGDLLADLSKLDARLPVRVACGAQDVVTPPLGCAAVARQCGVALQQLPGAGHASYVERPDLVADLFLQVLQVRQAPQGVPANPTDPLR